MPLHDHPLWIATIVPAAGLCAISFISSPHVFPGTPLSRLFLTAAAVDFALYSVWALFIYPAFYSPLRGLPEPKGGIPLIKFGPAAFKRPAGQHLLEFIKTVPNKGLIRSRGFLNIEHLLITSPEALSEVLVHNNYDYEKPAEVRNFLSKILGRGLVLTEGEEHKFQRKHITPAFSFRHIKDLIPVFWSKSVALRESVRSEIRENAESDGRAVVEVNHWANKVTLDIIGVAGLGRDFKALTTADDPLVRNYEELLEPTKEKLIFFVANLLLGSKLVSWLPWGLNERLNATTGTLKEFCLKLVREKRELIIKRDGDVPLDILSLLIKSDCFGDDTLIDQLLTFIAAGHETTSSAFTWATYLLAKNPSIQTRLRQEIRDNLPSPNDIPPADFDLATTLESLPLLHGVMQEVLRLYPSVPVTLRRVVKDTMIGEQFVPKGTRIQLAPWAINRSPNIWGPNSEEFIPERWVNKDGHLNNTGGALGNNYSNITFLHGPRSCIGEKFAKSEMKAMIAAFVGGLEMEMADLTEIAEPAGVITTKPGNGMNLRLRIIEGW